MLGSFNTEGGVAFSSKMGVIQNKKGACHITKDWEHVFYGCGAWFEGVSAQCSLAEITIRLYSEG